MPDIISMKQMYKVYPNGIVANDYVDFSVKEGEIHALVGENGAGKTTLMKILFGIEQATTGEILYNGQPIAFQNPQEAIAAGIGMVHQHFMQVGSMTVAENIVLGSEPKKYYFMLDQKKAIEDTAKIAEKYKFKINPSMRLDDCSVGTRQKIEILKALFHGAKVLILDEPTAVLTPQETEELFRELKGLKERGHTIIFISHKLNEVKEISDRVTVMRSAKQTGTYETASITKEEISNLMVGRQGLWELNKAKAAPRESIIEVQNLSVIDEQKRYLLDHISFSMRKGEILGVVGVEGNGQRELVDVLTGLSKASGGSIVFKGQDISKHSIHRIRQLGLSHIPEDRMTMGVATEASITDNLLSIYFDKETFSKGILLHQPTIDAWANERVLEYMVKTKSPQSQVRSLSGGNIQKVVVAREFSNNPEVIIADQPTRGIDVGAAQFIHNKLIELRDKGASILLVSADLSEVLDVSDSVIVMYEGKIVAYFDDVTNVSPMELGRFMLGIENQSDEQIRRSIYA
jgi:general nucleoside transport system ATP-binding protein